MKPLISYTPRIRFEEFEGARLRKSIKGALESNKITYATELGADFDIAHLISPLDELKVDEVKGMQKPVICSALYCENDPIASYLTYKSKDGLRDITINPKVFKFLSKVDLVLVPTNEAKEALISRGITTNIKVMLCGVNMARFDLSRDDEKDLFFRYFKEDRTHKLVIAMGEYTRKMDGISSLMNAAKKNKDVIFYYFGTGEKGKFNVKRIIRKLNKNSPSNLHFQKFVPDDIYRSALLNADIFVIPGYSPFGVTSLLDAMAAKCQIIARKQAVFSELIKNGETGYVAEFSETITSLIKDCLTGKSKPTTEKAYNFVKEHTLEKFGQELVSVYKEEISKNI